MPLIEIVSEPDMSGAEEAEDYARKVRAALQFAGVSDCKMQEGSIRFDVNLSVKPKGSTKLGTRTEMKNLNSFRSLVRAIEYEQKRQISVIEKGGEVVQETLRWDDAKSKTIAMRSKENAHDYRYFPDPDLVPVVLTDEYINNIKAQMPQMPDVKYKIYTQQYGLNASDALRLTEDRQISELFENAVKAGADANACANMILVDLYALLKEQGCDISGVKLSYTDIASLVKMTKNGSINNVTAKKVLAKVVQTGLSPEDIVKKEGLTQVNDIGEISNIVREVIKENPQSAADIKAGKTKAASFIVGRVMRLTKGKANPALVNQIIDEIIKSE